MLIKKLSFSYYVYLLYSLFRSIPQSSSYIAAGLANGDVVFYYYKTLKVCMYVLLDHWPEVMGMCCKHSGCCFHLPSTKL